MSSIAVVGAGVAGLHIAENLCRSLPSSTRITVISDQFLSETTSAVAGAIFLPTFKGDEFTTRDQFRRWVRSGWNHYRQIAESEESASAGLFPTSGYLLDFSEPGDPVFPSVCYDWRQLDPSSDNFGGFHTLTGKPPKKAVFCSTLQFETPLYLKWLSKKLISQNVVFRKKLVENLSELKDYDAIIVCCGLGARALLNDTTMTPIRGQVVRVKAPWIKHFVFDDHTSYIIPCANYVVLGGIYQLDREYHAVDVKDTEHILKSAQKLCPSLKFAKTSDILVAHRPKRKSYRLESDFLNNGHKVVPIVYCYGFGSNGYSLSWGASEDAVKLLKPLLTPKLSKL